MPLALLPIQRPGVGHHILWPSPAEDAVLVRFIVVFYVKVDVTVHHVGIASIQYFLNQPDLLYNMPRREGFYRGRQRIESPHCLMVALGVAVGELHRL